MERNNTRTTTPLRQNGKSAPQLIKDVLLLCLQNWYWFVLSLLVALGIGFYLTVQKEPVYLRTASIMVKDSKSADATEAMLKDMGIVQTSTNLTNELLMLKSSVVAAEVVKRLRLDVDYSRKGKFYDPVMYGISRPLEVRFLELNDQERASLTVALESDSTVVLSNLYRSGQAFDENVQARLGDTLETAIGRLVVIGSPYYREGATCKLDVKRTGLDAATSRVRSRLSAKLRDNNSSIIDISYRDVSPGRAEDVLNTLMAVYNEKWMQDRNRQIVSTNEFIRERLAVIESELGNVEQNISSYKSEHLITDVSQAGALAAAQVSEVESQSTELQNKISQLHTVYDYLISTQDDTQQIPFNLGIDNVAIVQKISEYNTLLLQRNNHLAYSSSQNPLVLDLNKQLASIRRSIVEALSNELSLLRTQLRNLQSVRSRAESRVATNPQQAKYLLSVERQQKVKEELYLFLLQKREENELSQAFTAYNSQIIEPAHGSWKPIEPVPKTIYLFAILLGLGIPAAFLFLKEVLTTTIQSREDLKQMSVPFAGEIPLATAKQGFFGRLFLKAKPHGKAEVLVVEKNRNMINEAFRVVRSNLEFLLGFDAGHKVVMLSSMVPGSGKTFTSANLSAAVGLKDKRVLAIDLDLRKASLSKYVNRPSHGVSDFLSGRKDEWRALLVQLGKVDLLPCGSLPPNPSELLYSPRFSQLMEESRAEYDYVFLDCPPVEMVADAAIINRYVDLTLFVVRAHMLDRSLLPEIDQWYTEKKYANMALILNGTDAKSDRYGYHKYGYHRYGYHYYSYAGEK